MEALGLYPSIYIFSIYPRNRPCLSLELHPKMAPYTRRTHPRARANGTVQRIHSAKDNVTATRKWHAQFAPDEIVSDDLVMFQQGRSIEEKEFRIENGQPWEEVSGVLHIVTLRGMWWLI